MDISRVTLQTEGTAVTLEKETDGTWTQLLEMFMSALKAHGFHPHNFEYIDGEVGRIDDIEDEAGFETADFSDFVEDDLID
jgi:hypothetical protein